MSEESFSRQKHSANLNLVNAIAKVKNLSRRLSKDDGTRPNQFNKVRAELEVAKDELTEARRRARAAELGLDHELAGS